MRWRHDTADGMDRQLLHGSCNRRRQILRIDLALASLDVMDQPIRFALRFGQLTEQRALILRDSLIARDRECGNARFSFALAALLG